MAETSDGLMELPVDAPVGENLRDYLGLDDNVIELDLTPNRADCLSVPGIARESGVLNKCEVNHLAIAPVAADINDVLDVVIMIGQGEIRLKNARAMESGQVGDTIEVLNPQTNRRISASIIGPNLATVSTMVRR